ncbi:hypothetical protein GYMLUDRAFT_971309 [Collybiopsis luxurians FD-317 M1]|uniref:Uncharacterized protein n=1 Tax=Collybiopsis luxurians FD-317 M1 TaxID=944289 RepID=A0A0D0C2V4_9AGAR|nr:hypothetical protein GYMLUDRAFT_971309 [Collybiopsis luxurians FD-317 M1]
MPNNPQFFHDPPPLPIPCDERGEYVRLLLPKKRGYPLWNPRPVGRIPDAYRANGVSIGDIGIMNEFGDFDYLFNIGLPPNNPNQGRVPHDFIPLPQALNNWSETDVDLRPGCYIASNHAYFRRSYSQHIAGYPQIPKVPEEVGAGLIFKTSTSRGALLILPEGGTRYDHPAMAMFLEHAERCATSWFKFINRVLLRGANEIYLVTGCDKTRAWGVACFSDADPRNVLLEYVPRLPRIAGMKPGYLFRRSDSALASAGADDILENQSGCTFLRGFRITARVGPQSREKISITQHSDWSTDGGLQKPPGTSKKRDGSTHKYSGQQMYHPSNVINKWILSKYQDIDIAITHDDDWASVIRNVSDSPKTTTLQGWSNFKNRRTEKFQATRNSLIASGANH